jgi:hypothetical protein
VLALGYEHRQRHKLLGEGFSSVGVSGRYLKQWEPDWLGTVIRSIEAASPRQQGEPPVSVKPHRLNRRLSAEMTAELVDAYKSGIGTPELCKSYELSKGGLLKILREHGVQMRCQPMSEDEINRAVRLRRRTVAELYR